jgi:peptidoglycan/xylan/chitin deacetylase (PgdA/CDA1 family)
MNMLAKLPVKIITYHYVKNPATTPYRKFNFLSTVAFKQQLKHIHNTGTFITINDIILCVEEGRPLPSNATLLTFDDGYSDHYDEVFPILKEGNIQGCFYPPGACIQSGVILDVNKIHLIMSLAPSPDAVLLTIKKYWLEDPPDVSMEDLWNEYAIANQFDSPQIIFLKRLLQHALPDPWRQRWLNKLFEVYVSKDPKDFSQSFYLKRDQIEEMISDGQHFGSHGYSHKWLDRLSLNEQREEITNSILFLNSVGSGEPLSICYPYGGWSAETLMLVKQFNFRIGLTIQSGVADLSVDNLLTLPRVDAAQIKS